MKPSLNLKHILFFSFVLTVLWWFSDIAIAQQHFEIPSQPYFWISTREDVFVKPAYDNLGPSVSLLRFGDFVYVSRCIPNCQDRLAWVELAPFGATRMLNLSPIASRTQEASFLANGPIDFIWAKVIQRSGITTTTGEHFNHNDELFFKRNTELQSQGFLERPDGGRVSVDSVQIFNPSNWSGWVNPPDDFAFVNHNTNLHLINGLLIPISRYSRYALLNISRNEVTIENGTLPRNDVRLGYKHQRPSSVPRNVRWVHVDLEQQILTAYDRNDDLVFATLVSTGSSRHPTRRGTFEVRRKISYTQMRGGGTRPYNVSGVPWVMYFDDAIALHGAFWHDDFGNRRSHGCVNLSLSDAQWLFNFNPATIPTGWRSVHPIVAPSTENMWVVVE